MDELTPNSEVNLSPDLEKARDEKCLPVAQAIIEEMVDHLLPETPGSTNQLDTIQLFVLQKMLDGEMNITTEAQYLFQLVLAAFSGFNNAVHAIKLVDLDDQRYLDIGRKMLRILADAKVRMVNVTPEDSVTDFASASEQLQALFDAEKLNKLELQYIMDSIFESVKNLNNVTSEGLAQSTAKAEAKIFGNEAMSDLTVKQVNDILVNDVKVVLTPRTPPEGQVTPEVQTAPAGDGQVAPTPDTQDVGKEPPAA